MEKFVSMWSDGKTLPESYIFPPEHRQGDLIVPSAIYSVPIIDLKFDDHAHLVHQVFEASQDYGCFQVHIQHLTLMDEARRVIKEFFELPVEEMSKFLSNDDNHKCILCTSSPEYDNKGVHCWRDALYGVYAKDVHVRMACLNAVKCIPAVFGRLLAENVEMAATRPDPRLTLGVGKHSDKTVIAILKQGDVPGFQVFKDGGEWVGVDPIPDHDALVVNLGYISQIASSGKLRNGDHRAVTNAKVARQSAALFIQPTPNCYIEPAKPLINAENAPFYRGFWFHEYLRAHAEVPESCIFPPDQRPGDLIVLKSGDSVPVIDMRKAETHGHAHLIHQIMQASQEYGCFQVQMTFVSSFTDYVDIDLLMTFVFKFRYWSSEYGCFERKCIPYMSTVDYDNEELHYWKDAVSLKCAPLEECVPSWPEKPAKFSDRSVITMLMQGDVLGLQVLKDGEWIGVVPISDAFAIFLGNMSQVLSSGKLKNGDHRVVTSSKASRQSTALFILPTRDCFIEPAKPLVNAENAPLDRGFRFHEYLLAHAEARRAKFSGSVLKTFQIN
ncbi:hypothetical protein Cgig2_014256 [Carnegiea gigantea]|uniref:Fe2OG dioxygenase domain-containing protein n=1 Tax=Carnegiea gigantea TaxID=171969 RepID=A0A9Q1QCC7_9CARY|nr:hypothetical protein Cgig2_014256 [Carnegiea gigantea]